MAQPRSAPWRSRKARPGAGRQPERQVEQQSAVVAEDGMHGASSDYRRLMRLPAQLWTSSPPITTTPRTTRRGRPAGREWGRVLSSAPPSTVKTWVETLQPSGTTRSMPPHITKTCSTAPPSSSWAPRRSSRWLPSTAIAAPPA